MHGGNTPSTNPSRRGQHLLAVVAVVVVLVPNLAAVLMPFEAFPWTSAPMFAHSPEAHERWVVHFTLVNKKGERRALPEAKVAGLNPWHFRRAFLVRVWGGDVEGTPYNTTGDDRGADAETRRAQRQARVERFFVALQERDERLKRHQFRGQRFIEISRVRRDDDDAGKASRALHEMNDAWKEDDTRPRVFLGRYDLQQRRFFLADDDEHQQGGGP